MKFLPPLRLGGELATTAGAFLFLLFSFLFMVPQAAFGAGSGPVSIGYFCPPQTESFVEDGFYVPDNAFCTYQSENISGTRFGDTYVGAVASSTLLTGHSLGQSTESQENDGGLLSLSADTEVFTAIYQLRSGPVGQFDLELFRAYFQSGSVNPPHNEYGVIKWKIGPDPSICQTDCFSNVLFLPGIKGSRLYRAADSCGESDFSSCAEEEKLWEPGLGDGAINILFGAGNDDVRDLFLDISGKSVRSDVYVKMDDIIDSAAGGDYYKSFIEDMDTLVTDETITDWEPVAYDWRLSLADILAGGTEVNGRISYTTATDTPYIEQTLRELAASSKSGKVTIIAHSNGGLVAKELLRQFGDEEGAKLVDKLILVGVPQSGAPRALGALLYGDGEGIPSFLPVVVGKATARQFAENSPMAYHLLPSAAYFETLNDPTHPVGWFPTESGEQAYEKERAAYGDTIDSVDELKNLALATDGGRIKPKASNVLEANVLNGTLLDYASQMHASLDDWTPPDDIEVYQIAGWGLNTIAGIEFYELADSSAIALGATHRRMHRPILFEDGDGVVPASSALEMDSVKKYWLNLEKYKKDNKRREHPDMLEVSQVRSFIENLLKNENASLPEFVVDSEPPPSNEAWWAFFLHSPLTLGIKDGSGNYTGLNEDGTITNGIDGIEYGQFGEVQYLIVPQGAQYTVVLNGLSSGTFTLDIQEVSGGTVTVSTTFTNVPTTENTIASLQIIDGIESATPLSIDTDGDGDEDVSIQPQAGQIVFYVEEQEEENGSQTALENTSPSSTDSSNAGGGGGGGGEGGVLYSTLSYGFVASSTASTTAATTTDAAIASTTPVGLTGTTTSATSTPELPAEQEESVNEEPVIEPKPEEPEQVGEVEGVATTSEPILPEAKTQTASALNAISQQSWLSKFTNSIYNLGKLLFARIYSLIKK